MLKATHDALDASSALKVDEYERCANLSRSVAISKEAGWLMTIRSAFLFVLRSRKRLGRQQDANPSKGAEPHRLA